MSRYFLFPALLVLLHCPVLQAAFIPRITSCPPDGPVYLGVGDILTLNISYECSDACKDAVSIAWKRDTSRSLKWGWDTLISKRGSGAISKKDNRASLVNGVNLALADVAVNDTGYYVVTFDIYLYHSPEVIFHVIVQGIPEVSLKFDTLIDRGTEYFQIVCDAKGDPEPTLSLYHNGTRVATNFTKGVYTVAKVDFRHAGNYTCFATNRYGTVSENLRLKVTGHLRDVTFKNKQYSHLATENFTIVCTAEGHEPKLTLYHNGKKISSNLTQANYTISEVKYQHAGNYTCVAENEYSTVSKSFHFDVKGSTRNVAFTNDKYSYLRDRNFKIICTAKGHGNLVYTLYHNGKEITNKNGVYIISKVEKRDAGNYTCVAKNDYDQNATSIDFEVRESYITITSTPASTVYVEVGKTLVLDISCIFWTRSKVWWGHNSREIVYGSIGHYTYLGNTGRASYSFYDKRVAIKDGMGLIISDVTFNDSGPYKVVVSMGGYRDRDTRIIHVIVQEQPKVKIHCNRDVNMYEGEAIKCECTAVLGTPTPWVEWRNKGRPIHNAAGYSKTTLSLENMKPEQAGAYNCIAKSGTLLDKKTVTINVKCPSSSVEFKNNELANLGMEYFYIVCSTECVPEPNYALYHNHTSITSNNGVYTIRDVKYADAGNYTCVAEYNWGVASESFSLEVADIDTLLSLKDASALLGTQNQTDKSTLAMSSMISTEAIGTPSQSGRSTLDHCEEKWKPEWYIILTALVFSILLGLASGFFTAMLLQRASTRKNEEHPTYHEPLVSSHVEGELSST